MAYNEYWLKLNGFESEEEARKVMSERGAKGKGKKKSYNWLRDNPDNASELGKKGAKSRWEKRS